jgi:N-acetylneuraminate synthase
MSKVQIVAEIGCNHNGSPELARQLVDEAARCGVDAVKFQTFSADALISRYAPKAAYQEATTGTADSQLEMTRALELPNDALLELWGYARWVGLDAFSTPFDLGSVAFLQAQGMRTWKIPAGEITNLRYLERIGSFAVEGKRIILSTGMATIDEVEACVSVLERSGTPRQAITLLHCNTEYPSPDRDMNLRAVRTLMEHFPDMQVGLSDHSVGAVAAIGAVALGACMVEKHFTLDKDLPGPDHKASATPDELRALVEGVRRMEVMLGSGQKVPSPSETPNKVVARKSLVAARDIRKGEVLTEENMTCKRPGSGISPMSWYDVLGRAAERDFGIDELIEVEGFEPQR